VAKRAKLYLTNTKNPTMKKAILFLTFIVSVIGSYSQGLFFNHLNNTTWIATLKSKDSTIKNAKEIALGKLTVLKDSLKMNATCWSFKDGVITITHYDYQLKTETPVAIYNYQPNVDKGILTIALPDASAEFKVGINSFGNFALLMREKEKRKNLKTL
jgi:hypothetical protein